MNFKKLTTMSLVFFSISSYAANQELSFKEKLEALYDRSAPIEEKIQVLTDEFYSLFSYQDFLLETSKEYFKGPQFLKPMYSLMLANANNLENNINQFCKNDCTDFAQLYQQIINFFDLYGQENNLVVSISLALENFEEAMDLAMSQLKEVVEEYDDRLLLNEISQSEVLKQNMEKDFGQFVLPPGARKDVVLMLVMKRATKDFGVKSK